MNNVFTTQNSIFSGLFISPSCPYERLVSLKASLVAILDNPFVKAEVPHPAQLTLSILNAKADLEKACCQIRVNGDTVTFSEDDEGIVVSLNTTQTETVRLCNVTMAQLKEAVLIHFLTEQRRCGNLPVDVSQFDLSGIQLKHVDFKDTLIGQKALTAIVAMKGDLSGVTLAKDSHVKGMSFAGVRMDAAVLDVLIDGRADLRGIDVSGQDLRGMSLINVDFSGSNFAGTNLDGANLKCTDFTNVKLTLATLVGAKINYAIFTHISDAQIRSAKGQTKLNFKQLPQMSSRGDFNLFNPAGLPSNNNIDKTKPYFKIGGADEQPNETRNIRVPFQGGREANPTGGPYSGLIVCRHSAAIMLVSALHHPDGKFNYRRFSTEQLLAKNVPYEAERLAPKLVDYAKQTYLVTNNQFSRFLVGQFKQMCAEETHVRGVYLQLPKHVTCVLLRVYINSAKEKMCSIELMEPTLGEASPVRCKVTDIEQLLRSGELVDYLCGSDGGSQLYERYYPDSDDDFPDCSLASVWDQASLIELEQTGRVENQEYYCDTLEPAPLAVSFAMYYNKLSYLVQLKDKASLLSQSELYKVLRGCDLHYSHEPMAMAMCCGHVEVIKAYGELVKLVADKGLRADLLFPKSDRTAWVRSAMAAGNFKAVMAWFDVVSELL